MFNSFVFLKTTDFTLENQEMQFITESNASSPFTNLPFKSGTYEIYLAAVDYVGNVGNMSKPYFLSIHEGKDKF